MKNNGNRRKSERCEIANKNKELRIACSASRQLEILNNRLGKNIGAKRERLRLQSIVEKENNATNAR
jgi:hypothetical protein